ncbi:hypothetical protein N0V86_001930 [Didymella sp. IMI 355093]|nr:hypothetical protein N0V86_001930 [Didymella sp. IMI 355093]
MDHIDESPLSMSQFRPMIVSPDMSPQLNPTICGCRSGCGCGCLGDGTNNGDGLVSDAETAVNSEDNSDEGRFAQGERTHDNAVSGHDASPFVVGVHSPRASSSQDVALFLAEVLNRLENRQTGALLLGRETSFQSARQEELEEMVEGLCNGRFSPEEQRNAVSGRASVHMESPGPGIGGWVHFIPEPIRNEPSQRVYILTPLRLSAES